MVYYIHMQLCAICLIPYHQSSVHGARDDSTRNQVDALVCEGVDRLHLSGTFLHARMTEINARLEGFRRVFQVQHHNIQ